MHFLLTIFLIFLSLGSYAQVKDVVPGNYTPGFSSHVNFVKNPNCFLNDRNITESGTGAVTRTTTDPLEGIASCSVSGSSSGDKVTFDSRAMDKALRGQNCEASFMYSGDGSKWKAYVTDGTTNSQEVQLEALGNYPGTSDPQSTTVTIPYPCGSLSAASKPVIEATASTPSAIKVSSVYIGKLRNIVTSAIITPWKAYTPVFTGFGTVTCSDCIEWRQVGSNIELRGKFVSGVSTAVEGRISLPNNYTSAAIPSIQMVGQGARSISSTTISDYSVLIEPSTSYITFSIFNNSTYAPLTKQNANALISSTESMSIYASIPIAGLSSSTQVLMSQCGALCREDFSAKISSTGVVSDEPSGGDWINSNCVVSTSTFTCTLNTNIGVTTGMTCNGTPVGVGNTQDVSVSSTTSTTVVMRTTRNSADTPFAFHLRCSKAGVDALNSRVLVASLKYTPTTIGSNGSDFQSVYFGLGATCATACTTGTCNICHRVGTKITSVTHTGTTGQYLVNGIDGTKYNCTGTAGNNGFHPAVHNREASASTYARMSFGYGTTAENTLYGSIICIGVP